MERRLPRPAQIPSVCHGDEEEDGDEGDACADVTGETIRTRVFYTYFFPQRWQYFPVIVPQYTCILN